MRRLARGVRRILRTVGTTGNFVYVSSGTAEMRAAWFLVKAIGNLPATMLQVGSPAEPLFGAANVREVRLDTDWSQLRDLVMPRGYFGNAEVMLAVATRSMREPRLLYFFALAIGSPGATDTSWMIAPEDVAEMVATVLRIPAHTMVSRVEMRPSQPKE